MYLIVGLGNPEQDYANTRHNMGFNVINKLADKHDIPLNKKKFNGIYGSGIINEQKVILLKPQTYMNLSGDSIIEFKNYYKIEDSNIIVIYDDFDTDVGKIRVRKEGSGGSHNGMKSVIYSLQTQKFPRIRIGIGRSDEINKIEYVIGAIPDEEKEILDNSASCGAEAVEEILRSGIDIAMNKFNK